MGVALYHLMETTLYLSNKRNLVSRLYEFLALLRHGRFSHSNSSQPPESARVKAEDSKKYRTMIEIRTSPSCSDFCYQVRSRARCVRVVDFFGVSYLHRIKRDIDVRRILAKVIANNNIGGRFAIHAIA